MKKIKSESPKRIYWCRECKNRFDKPKVHFYKRGPGDPDGSVWVCPWCESGTQDWLELPRERK